MTHGWKGNALGLQRWEVEHAHNTRLDATEAIADRMRRGETFDQAKEAVMKIAKDAFRHSRKPLLSAQVAMVEEVRFSDMPKDITRKIEADFLDDIESRIGRKLSPLSRWCYRLFGFWF